VIPIEANQVRRGTTVDMTFDGDTVCGDASSEPDVWYYIDGKDEFLSLTTCTDIAAFNGADHTRLQVFVGSCEQLFCVDDNDNDLYNTCDFKSRVRFFAADGFRYYVLVRGGCHRGSDFALQVKSDKNNDLCDNAILLLEDKIVQGTTADMTSKGEPACGNASASNDADVWYTIEVRTGQRVVITTRTSLASMSSTFNTQLSVFSGECGNLVCDWE
jgi:hypothetical protein